MDEAVNDTMIEKMILELMPPEYRTNILQFLKALRENSNHQSMLAMQEAGYLFHSPTKMEAVNSINSFLTGVAFMYNWAKHPDVMREAAHGFLEMRNRKQGLNVINFLDRKADKPL